MKNRTIPASILVMVAIATFSCSKTQDTAPERRVFGDPPVIETVEPNFFEAQRHIECDFTPIMRGFFCPFFGNDVEFIAGRGWQLVPPHDSGPISAEPGVFIDGDFGEITLKVKVSDPDSPPPPGQTNILLVSASYPDTDPANKTESSLVLFDDGSFNKFKFPQKITGFGEDCSIDANGVCNCYGAKYDVLSGDQTAGDGTFTRKLALPDKRSLPPPADGFLQDCILRDTGDTPLLSSQGDVYDFKIEAVDRQGNLTKWPVRLKAVIGTSNFACSGDPCACCFMQTNDVSQCSGLDGVLTPAFPDGYCKIF
jgi:hypothetical protein